MLLGEGDATGGHAGLFLHLQLAVQLAVIVAEGTLEIARAAEAGGADALSMINTLTGMKIDIHRQTFAIANKTGGVSGPAVHPIAVRMVYQTAQVVNIPIIGMGGVQNAEDAIEFLLAGATAVAVGTANFHNPMTTVEVIDGIADYMKAHQAEKVTDLIGAVHG